MGGLGGWSAWLLLVAASPAGSGTDAEIAFLLLDLQGDGLFLSDTAYPVSFDIDSDGAPEWIAWTAAGREEAFLWLDRNGNAAVDGGGELFGSRVGFAGGRSSAFAELAVLDRPERGGDGDGVLTASDALWSHLRLWVDRDHDGRSSAGEQTTLAQGGIRALGLTFREVFLFDASANWIRGEGRFERAGAVEPGRLFEVEFAKSPPATPD